MSSERFEYKFKKQGSSTPGHHCTYCPQGQAGTCSLPCNQAYEAVLKERAADGVVVNDEP